MDPAQQSWMAPRYQHILSQVEPYLLCYGEAKNAFNLHPFDYKIPDENVYSCVDSTKKNFFLNLQHLDSLAFGPAGMPMERWVFFDCAEMPGAAFGFGIRAKNLSASVLSHYEAATLPDDLVPLSMYIAIPMVLSGQWFGHNLCSANRILENVYDFSGLALLTKALGVKVMRIQGHFGATQWDSGSLNIHTQLSTMQLKSAYTPAHSFDETITYYSTYPDEKIMAVLRGETLSRPEADFYVESKDQEIMKKLQLEIEEGQTYTLINRPVLKDGKKLIPIKKGIWL